MYRVAIVEDQPSDAAHLRTMLTRYTGDTGTQFQVSTFDRPNEFLSKCNAAFDLVLMDIELPGMNGMEAARRLRELDSVVTLIFVTNMAQYALNGYEVGALDFVLKPVNYAAFSMKLTKAVKAIKKQGAAEINLILPNGFIRLSVSQIQYVEVDKHYLTYHTYEGDYTVRESLKAAEARLAPFHFLRCNNCYLVNLRHVTSVYDNVVNVDGVSLQISRPRRVAFLKGLADYLGGSI